MVLVSVAYPCARRLLLQSLTTCAAASLEQLRPLLVLPGSPLHAFSSLAPGPGVLLLLSRLMHTQPVPRCSFIDRPAVLHARHDTSR
jgi:hypothetical protein